MPGKPPITQTPAQPNGGAGNSETTNPKEQKMADTLDTKHIQLPRSIADDIVTKTRESSVIQTLSAAKPVIFQDATNVLFAKEPEAEFVDEGQAHTSMGVDFKPVQGIVKKAHVTVRLNKEVKWADEDNKLKILDTITDSAAAALGRALDYAVFHAVNPAAGSALTGVTALTAGANAVKTSGDATADLDALVAAVPDYDVSGIALSKAYAGSLRAVRAKGTGARLFPEIPLNLRAGQLDGIAAATSSTVNGAKCTTATDVLAILGDFNLIRWGMVRDIYMDVITAGDPDNRGYDLAYKDEIAYRVGVVYSFACIDPKGFAVLKAK